MNDVPTTVTSRRPPRGLPRGGVLTYTVTTEAWYGPTLTEDDRNELTVTSASEGGGCFWEFQIHQVSLGGKWCTQVRIFDDAYQAFVEVPDLFAALNAAQPRTLDAVRTLLDDLGAQDATVRVQGQRSRVVWLP